MPIKHRSVLPSYFLKVQKATTRSQWRKLYGAFDHVTALAARLLKTPIALVTLVDKDRVWFKSRHGLDLQEIPRNPGLCASVILSDDAYVVKNALHDPRTLANPLVAGEFGLRFYAAAPLITHDNYRLGTLCVLDFKPRNPRSSR